MLIFLDRPAAAHPLGNFTINHLTVVHVARHAIRLRYVLDMAEIPSFQVMREHAIDGDRRLARLAGWATSQLPGLERDLELTVDGSPRPLTASLASVSTRLGAGGLPTIYMIADLRAALPAAASRDIVVHDRTYPGRIGWKDVVTASEVEPTQLLTAYPSALLGSPRDVATLQIHVALDGSALVLSRTGVAPSAASGPSSASRSNTLADMLARGATGPLAVIITLLVALGLGALHALEPGHGKTLLAVSLVGARATPAQAVILAAALTLAHTAGVLALGIVMLAAAQWIVPERVYPWLTLVSGLIVAGLGARALSNFVKSRRGVTHTHAHDHAAGHSHGAADRGHHHAVPGDKPLTFGSVVMIATSGNIAPCPAALVVLLTAVTLHQVGYGLVVIIAFSIGLAAVLTGLGIGLIHGAAVLSRVPAFDRFAAWGPLASAAVIAVIGAIMVGQGFAENPFLGAPALLVTPLMLVALTGYALSPGHTHAGGAAHADPTTVLR